MTSTDATYCWGAYINAVAITVPALVSGFTFASTSSSYQGSCGLTAAGAGYCWGINNLGQLGDGSQTNRLVPVAVRAPQ
ncbi:MAG: RCC1 domain-containing protein [Gemmatimonadaceae bacterium]